MRFRASLLALVIAVAALSCSRAEAPRAAGKGTSAAGTQAAGAQAADTRMVALRAAVAAAALPAEAERALLAKVAAEPERFFSLLERVSALRRADPGLFARADKEVALEPTYEPADLVSLDGTRVAVSRKGHRLRAPAFDALLRMNAAAAAEGVTLLVGSSYRSYAYQKQVFDREVAASGEAEAARTTARPGRSQHQLGTAVDFAPISADFAGTKAGRWVAARAGAFGFSRSYPEGMESVTGYIPESWHWRYIGADAVALQDLCFGGVQHYLLKFLQVWPE